MPPGRNEPCPCGSGRKHKHCCLAKAQSVPADELVWRRVRRAIEPLADQLFTEARQRFGTDSVLAGWNDFNLHERELPIDRESPLAELFFSWFFHDWQPESDDLDDPDDPGAPDDVLGLTVARAYLDRVGPRLDPLARRYLETCCDTPFSFHEITECTPGRGLRLTDVLLCTEAEVIEKLGSRTLQRGDIVYARVVRVEGIALIEGIGPVAIPPGAKPLIIDTRKALDRAPGLSRAEALRASQDQLREIYLALAQRQLNPGPPELRNTDGDPIELHTLVFDLDAPEEAVYKLADLAAGFDEPLVERDDGGRFVRAELAWLERGNRLHKTWDNTTLGTITVEGARLTADVNSAKRAARLRKLIEQRLGDAAHARPSVVQSMQAALGREPTARERAATKRREREEAELAARPEVQALIREQTRAHYRGWVDTKLPALRNKTPRHAMRTADGREAVAALVTEIERDGARMQPPLDPEVLRELRETLGL